MVLAGGKGTRLYPLTKERAKPAVPFGGKYRIVDFVLSNLINSGVYSTYVLTQFKSQTACDSREALFRTIESGLPTITPGVLPRPDNKDLYNLVSTRVFRDYSDSPATRLELLASE